MNKLILITLILSATLPSFGKPTKKSSSLKSSPMKANLGTRFEFNELNVHGKYQNGFEGIASVENEKSLDDLLDYRQDFKNRISQSKNFEVKP